MKFGTVGPEGDYISTGIYSGMIGRKLVDIDGDARFCSTCFLSASALAGLEWYADWYDRLLDDINRFGGRADVHAVVLDGLFWLFDNVGLDSSFLCRYSSVMLIFGNDDEELCECLFSRFLCLADFFSSVPRSVAIGCLRFDEIGRWFRSGVDDGLSDEAIGVRIVEQFDDVASFFRNLPVLSPAGRFIDYTVLWYSYRVSLPRLREVNSRLFIEVL